MNCYFSRSYKGLGGAGSKARVDIEHVMEESGFHNIGIGFNITRNRVKAFFLNLWSVVRASALMHRGDRLLVQYPLSKFYGFIALMSRIKGVRLVVLVHDLNSLRVKHISVKKEIARLNRADDLIVHNPNMKAWLERNGIKCRMSMVDVFDYLSETEPAPFSGLKKNEAGQPVYSVFYAGALNSRKNPFLYRLGRFVSRTKVHLYGEGFEMDKAEGNGIFEYMGFVQSDRLIATVEGDFGLIWDGDSLDGCSGDFGEYLKINTPHKTALSFRCGLPVIVWKEAAVADYVMKEHAGIVVSSLKDLDERLSSLPEEEYLEMRSNAGRIGMELSRGEHFGKCFRELGMISGIATVNRSE